MPKELSSCFVCGNPVSIVGVICDSPVCQNYLVDSLNDLFEADVGGRNISEKVDEIVNLKESNAQESEDLEKARTDLEKLLGDLENALDLLFCLASSGEFNTIRDKIKGARKIVSDIPVPPAI